MLDTEFDTGVRVRSLVSFLQSNDPGNTMPSQVRLALLGRCEALIDCSYLEDRWPGVGNGALRYPDNQAPPSLSPRHQQVAQERAATADRLAEDVSKKPLSLLKQWCRPLGDRLSELQDLLSLLMIDCKPSICADVEAILAGIGKRPLPKDGAGCRIASDSQQLAKLGSDPLGPTIDAVRSLLELGCGTGDGSSFTKLTQPAYFDKWTMAVKAMERGDWPRFHKLAETLTQLRATLLPPPVPNRPYWLQDAWRDSPPPLAPRPT